MIVFVEIHKDEQLAARRHDAAQLVERPALVGAIVKGLDREDLGEVAVGGGNLLRRSPDIPQIGEPGRGFPGAVQHFVGDVETYDLACGERHAAGGPTGPAAQIEDAISATDL